MKLMTALISVDGQRPVLSKGRRPTSGDAAFGTVRHQTFWLKVHYHLLLTTPSPPFILSSSSLPLLIPSVEIVSKVSDGTIDPNHPPRIENVVKCPLTIRLL